MSFSSINRKHDFLPARESELVGWLNNFSTKLNSPPGPEQFGISLAQASHCAALNLAYAQAYRVATDPATSSRTNIAAKNTARKALTADARMLARIIRANPDVTDAQRIELGLTVPDEHLTPVGVPLEAPVLSVMQTMGRTVRLQIVSGPSSLRKARPDGMIGALILTYVAPPNVDHAQSARAKSPPLSSSQWSYCRHAMRSKFAVTVSPEVPPGSKVWFAACWVNRRGRTGPMSTPVSAFIGDGVATLSQSLRVAA